MRSLVFESGRLIGMLSGLLALPASSGRFDMPPAPLLGTGADDPVPAWADLVPDETATAGDAATPAGIVQPERGVRWSAAMPAQGAATAEVVATATLYIASHVMCLIAFSFCRTTAASACTDSIPFSIKV
jgi:hypothetical protein